MFPGRARKSVYRWVATITAAFFRHKLADRGSVNPNTSTQWLYRHCESVLGRNKILVAQSFYRFRTLAILAACALAPAAAAATPEKSAPLPRPRPVGSPPAGKARPAVIKSTPASAPRAFAATATTSAEDLAAVKKALDLIRAGKNREASDSARSVGDPLARKLIEWVVLRNEDDNIDFERYATFIAANPGWPSIGMFRRKAEAALWQDQLDSNVVRGFFASIKPTTGKGRLALARVMLAQGDRAGAQQYAREAWRQDAQGVQGQAQASRAQRPGGGAACRARRA